MELIDPLANRRKAIKWVNVQADTYISCLLVTNPGDSCTSFWGAVSAGGDGWGPSVAYRGGLGGSTPSPKVRRPSKIVPNSSRLWKLLKIAEFRTLTPQDVRKKGSKIPNYLGSQLFFTLAITNKLVVIINSLKVPEINNVLVYEMKFLVPNYSCLQHLWLGGYHPQIPVLSVLCPQLNLLTPPLLTKFLGTPLGGGGWTKRQRNIIPLSIPYTQR